MRPPVSRAPLKSTPRIGSGGFPPCGAHRTADTGTSLAAGSPAAGRQPAGFQYANDSEPQNASAIALPCSVMPGRSAADARLTWTSSISQYAPNTIP